MDIYTYEITKMSIKRIRKLNIVDIKLIMVENYKFEWIAA